MLRAPGPRLTEIKFALCGFDFGASWELNK